MQIMALQKVLAVKMFFKLKEIYQKDWCFKFYLHICLAV